MEVKKLYKSGIYMWTSPEGKSYVGQAINLQRRKTEFLRNPNKKIYTSANSAIDNARKLFNDFSKWTYQVLEYCPIEKLDSLEEFYINLFNTYKNGYNLTMGADSTGYIATEETKHKQSIAHKGEKAYWYGKTIPDEIRKKISISRIGKYTGKDNPNYGNHLSEEIKQKLRKLKSKKIIQYTIEGEYVAEYESAKEAAEMLNTKIYNISRAALGKTSTCKGYIWKYKQDIDYVKG